MRHVPLSTEHRDIISRPHLALYHFLAIQPKPLTTFADRFALFIEAADWQELSDGARTCIAHPGGEGRIADDGGALRSRVKQWRKEFLHLVERCPASVVNYAVAATSALNAAGIRISPRRSRLIARSLLGASIAAGGPLESVYRQVLKASIPQGCWGVKVSSEVVAAAHRVAWESASENGARWIHRFHAEPSLARKLAILLSECQTPDEGTQAVAQLIAYESRERAAAFAFAVYPAAAMGHLAIGPEGVNDLGKIAGKFLSTDGEISWQERQSQNGTQHPEYSRCALAVEKLRGPRRERARQFFNGCLVEGLVVREPAALEKEIEACVQRIQRRGLA